MMLQMNNVYKINKLLVIIILLSKDDDENLYIQLNKF